MLAYIVVSGEGKKFPLATLRELSHKGQGK